MSVCQYRKCRNQPSVAYEIDGNLYYLCVRHFRLVFKWMNRLCEKYGYASSRWLKVKVRNRRITQIYADEERIKEELGQK
ncbi:MAG: hypothetical protein JRC86_01495 [Deltaproteobacteria bacterium]|nr:hypothetical protein [Deltaproteobacteria bacterium]